MRILWLLLTVTLADAANGQIILNVRSLKMYSLERGHVYTLDPNPENPNSLTPAVTADQHAKVGSFRITSDTSTTLIVSFELPSYLVRSKDLHKDSVSCDFSDSSFYDVNHQRYLSPREPQRFQIAPGETLTLRLGMSVHFSKSAYPNRSYNGTIGVAVLDSLRNVTAKKSLTVSLGGVLRFYEFDGEMQHLSRGHDFSLDPAEHESLSVSPKVTGQERGTPISVYVKADSGYAVEVKFTLPSSAIGAISGSIPLSYDSLSAYCVETGEQWDADVPHVLIPGRSRRLEIRLGVSASISDTTSPDQYTCAVHTLVRDISSNVYAGTSLSSIGAVYTVGVQPPPVGVRPTEPLPGGPRLHQNFPNPFNPSTEISFSLRERTHVTLRIVDLLGRHIVTLVDEVREAGVHRTEWNAVALSSGSYYCILNAGNSIERKRMSLVK